MSSRRKDRPFIPGERKSARRSGSAKSANLDQPLNENGFPQLTPKQQAEADSLDKPPVFGTRVFAYCNDGYYYSAVVMRDSVDGRSCLIRYLDGKQERTLPASSVIPLACLELEDQITVSKPVGDELELYRVAISQKPLITDHANWTKGTFKVDGLDDKNKKITKSYNWSKFLINQEQKVQFADRYDPSKLVFFDSGRRLNFSPVPELNPTPRRPAQKRKRKTLTSISDETNKNDFPSNEEVPAKQRKHDDQVLGSEAVQVLLPDTNVLPSTDSEAASVDKEQEEDMSKKEADIAIEQANSFQQPTTSTEFIAQEETNLPVQQELSPEEKVLTEKELMFQKALDYAKFLQTTVDFPLPRQQNFESSESNKTIKISLAEMYTLGLVKISESKLSLLKQQLTSDEWNKLFYGVEPLKLEKSNTEMHDSPNLLSNDGNSK